jgi:hypothetical protein
MAKNIESIPYGPGNTYWYANNDGSLSICRWNDRGWFSQFARSDEINPDDVSRMLRDAYKMGLKDQQEIVRRAIGAAVA